MSPAELEEQLAAGRVLPAYLLAGEEPLLRDTALAALRSAVLGGALEDFNLARLEGDSATPADLVDSVRTLPVMAPRRLVVLREPEAGRAAGRGLLDALAGVVRELLALPEAQATAVLAVVAARIDRRAGWVKAFGAAAVVQCDAPRAARELLAFARGEAARQGVVLAEGAAELLVERIGPQLLWLRQEIAKSALLAGPGQPVARAHVAAGTRAVAEEPIWDLTDAIGEGRIGDALGLLARLLRAGAPPPVVLGALVSHFRRLLRVASGGGVAGPPFVQRKLKSQAQRYSPTRLLACLRAIHDTDTALKGQGALAPELALERLLIALV